MISVGTRRLPAIHRARTRDLEPLISLLTAAFVRTGLGTQLISDEHARSHVLRSYFRIIIAHAMTYGQVDVIGLGQAATIWYPHDGPDTPAIPGYTACLAEATGPHLSRFVALDAARTRHHPTGRPHHHLAYAAVLPALRGQRLGTRLLEHRLLRPGRIACGRRTGQGTRNDQQDPRGRTSAPFDGSSKLGGVRGCGRPWRGGLAALR